ncbi:hypothetical protein GOV09_06415 [Candidatus Woesearchaeota archaeon]|nr:hypothetical protein [Candidatus Woesearchaeota archaeon]
MNIVQKAFKRFEKDYWKIFFVDLMAFVLIFLLYAGFWKLFYSKIQSIQIPDTIFQLTESEIDQLLPALQHSFTYFIVLIVVFIIVGIIVWSILRALVWRLSFHRKGSMKYGHNAMYLGLLWYALVGMGFVIISTLKQQFIIWALGIYVLLVVYLSMMVFMHYAITGKINFLPSLKAAFTRWDFFLAFVIVFLAYVFLSSALTLFINIHLVIGGIISIIIYLLYFAYVRFLFVEIQKRG